MAKKRLFVFAAVFFLSATAAFPQKNELSFSVGGMITSDQRATSVFPFTCPVGFPNCNIINSLFQADAMVSFEGNYARRLVSFGPGTLYAEVPVVVVPSRDVNAFTAGLFAPGSSISGSVTFSSSALFFTPSAKVKFFEPALVSPFVTIGGGLAHSGTHLGIGGVAGIISFSSNTGALQFGGGLDFKSPIPHLGFRAEARDFYSGSGAQSFTQGAAILQTTLSPVHLHHVFAGGGAFLRF
jgi:hypothetical protein